ncbi:MAG: M1 family metallopeptidase [Acidobacteria bacterium]|nr:M1 family metallopeptidase [Acidobacteriota bacterium]
MFPTTPVGGAPREFVFLGKARFQLDPPDEIEAQQFELFTHARRIDVEAQELVFVASDPTLASHFAGGAPTVGPEPALQARAGEVLSRWRASAEHDATESTVSLVLAAAGDTNARGFCAIWILRSALPPFVYVIDPPDEEQISVKRFIPATLDDTERFRERVALTRLKREGRALNASLAHAGTWDTWASWTQRSDAGTPVLAPPQLAPQRYEIDAALESKGERIRGRVTAHLRAPQEPVVTTVFVLHADLHVSAAHDDAGRRLDAFQIKNFVIVRLAEPTTPDQRVAIALDYDGVVLEKVASRSFTSWSTLHWHPRVATLTATTYDVTLRWPSELDLFASGRKVDGGEKGKDLWGRWVVEAPAPAFGFELGDYTVVEENVGDVTVRFAATDEAIKTFGPESPKLFLGNAVAVLKAYLRLFGDYPHDELDIVTTPLTEVHSFSQGLPGLVVLAVGQMRQTESLGLLAHEMAHQWYPHVVAPASDRDAWLSEGMAEYASLVIERLARKQLKSGPVGLAEYRERMRERARHGGLVADTGPISIGPRLDSSLCYFCYQPIVYGKGAMVLESIASTVGFDAFAATLKALGQEFRHRTISTDQFFAFLESRHGVGFRWLRETFIDGSGLPYILYEYEFKQKSEQSWAIDLTMTQLPHVLIKNTLSARADGSVDFRRYVTVVAERPKGTMTIPYRVRYFKAPDDRKLDRETLRHEESVGNQDKTHVVRITGDSARTSLDMDFAPLSFVLDPEDVVPIVTLNATLDPRAATKRRALVAWSRGKLGEAEELLRGSLATVIDPEALSSASNKGDLVRWYYGKSTSNDAWINRRAEDILEEVRCLRDADERALLADLALEQDRLADARTEASESRALVRSCKIEGWVAEQSLAVHARVLLREGKKKEASSLLWKSVADGEYHSTYLWGVTAVVAHATGDDELKKKALDKLEEGHVDVSILKAAR